MSRRIYYYTRTGTCAKVADTYTKDGKGYKVQVVDIPEDKYQGFWGFIRGGFDALTNKKVSYSLVGDKYTKADEIEEIILITPVWAGKVQPTFRTFLLNEKFNPEVTVQVVTLSQSGKGREVFKEIVELLQKMGVREIRHKNLKEKDVI